MEDRMHSQSSRHGSPSSILVVGLWIAQVLLACLFLFAGATHSFTPVDVLREQTGIVLPGIMWRVIGGSEILGALGLILPGLLRIRTELTPLAGAGLAVLMVGATMFTPPEALVLGLIPLTLGALAAAVAYGRWRLAPHGQRRSLTPRAVPA
jgi:DoxX-like family